MKSLWKTIRPKLVFPAANYNLQEWQVCDVCRKRPSPFSLLDTNSINVYRLITQIYSSPNLFLCRQIFTPYDYLTKWFPKYMTIASSINKFSWNIPHFWKLAYNMPIYGLNLNSYHTICYKCEFAFTYIKLMIFILRDIQVSLLNNMDNDNGLHRQSWNDELLPLLVC